MSRRDHARDQSVVRRAPREAAVALLAVAERELRVRRPDLPWRGFDAVRGRLTPDRNRRD